VPSSPIVIAHRGASGYRPEHSRSAYELAFELGADAVEPDIVATRDGVLVVRHENEISGTTDVAAHAEFANRRTTKTIDGISLTGWFTEDFTWAELSTLRVVERIPKLRPESARFDGTEPMLRLRDVRDMLDAASAERSTPIVMVAEIKHATYFASIGLPLDELFAAEMADWATAENLVVESFEQSVLLNIRQRGIPGKIVYLIDATGGPADRPGTTYASQVTDESLAILATEVDGISVDRSMIVLTDATGAARGVSDIVDRAHGRGLLVFTWTLRAENRFLARNHRIGLRGRDIGDWATEFALVMGSGVDGVFADQPDRALIARAALHAS
jgi:glycerophosphoryl diester phosphodiesterase